MNRIGLGTVNFGMNYGIGTNSSPVSGSNISKIINICHESGIDMIDTAINYGNSENALGRNKINSFQIVTKLPKLPTSVNLDSWTKKQITNSLEKLQISSLHGLLLHSPDDLMSQNGEKLYESIKKLQHAGMIKKIGISVYSPKQLNLLTRNFDFEIVQAPLNILDNRFELEGCFKNLKKKNIEIHARSIFLKGLLLKNISELSPYFNKWNSLLRDWKNWLGTENYNPTHACINYALSFPEIDRVLVGVRSPNQLIEIIRCCRLPNISQFPSLNCEDEDLLNPTNWKL